MPNLTGQSIGRYHILEQLGEGGMATVYKAYDTRLERNVALKVLRTDQFIPAQLQMVLQRFEREAKSLAKLKHSNIVNILDFGEHEEMPYLVMEYLPGGTLKQKLGLAIPWQKAIQTLLPVARGLAYAHQHGVIHRDVKPANVLIDQNEEPILTDFGIAKLLEGTAGHTLTGSGVGIGTPEYMAPEQGIGAHTIDARADIYSLGIVLFEMVTGRKPYIADTPMAVVLKQMTDPLPRPTEFVPDLPEEIEQILFKALAKQPEDRYEDMNAMIAAMTEVLTEAQTVLAPTSPKPAEETTAPRVKPSPKMALAVLGALAVILFLGAGISWAMKQFPALPVAEATSTKTSTPPSTSTATLTSPTATVSTESVMIGATQVPIASIMDYLSIMNYITNTPPDFKDDFSKANSLWQPITTDVAVADLLKFSTLDLSLDAQAKKEKFALIPKSMRATHFAIEFDFYLEDVAGFTTLDAGFPSKRGEVETNFDTIIDLENQKWFIGFNDGTLEQRGDINGSLKGKWSHLQIVFFNRQIGFFLDDNFLGTAEGIDHEQDNIWVYVFTEGQARLKVDNFKFWNLDGVKLK